jgi:hypothetical protein
VVGVSILTVREIEGAAGELTCAGPSGALAHRGSMGRVEDWARANAFHLDDALRHARVKLRRSPRYLEQLPDAGRDGSPITCRLTAWTEVPPRRPNPRDA